MTMNRTTNKSDTIRFGHTGEFGAPILLLLLCIKRLENYRRIAFVVLAKSSKFDDQNLALINESKHHFI